MKREIYCTNCTTKLKVGVTTKMISEVDAYLSFQEKMYRKTGELIRDCLCDYCNKALNKGEIATAITFVGIGQQYLSWESEFIY